MLILDSGKSVGGKGGWLIVAAVVFSIVVVAVVVAALIASVQTVVVDNDKTQYQYFMKFPNGIHSGNKNTKN